jgi:hypothetical protein
MDIGRAAEEALDQDHWKIFAAWQMSWSMKLWPSSPIRLGFDLECEGCGALRGYAHYAEAVQTARGGHSYQATFG